MEYVSYIYNEESNKMHMNVFLDTDDDINTVVINESSMFANETNLIDYASRKYKEDGKAGVYSIVDDDANVLVNVYSGNGFIYVYNSNHTAPLNPYHEYLNLHHILKDHVKKRPLYVNSLDADVEAIEDLTHITVNNIVKSMDLGHEVNIDGIYVEYVPNYATDGDLSEDIYRHIRNAFKDEAFKKNPKLEVFVNIVSIVDDLKLTRPDTIGNDKTYVLARIVIISDRFGNRHVRVLYTKSMIEDYIYRSIDVGCSDIIKGKSKPNKPNKPKLTLV